MYSTVLKGWIEMQGEPFRVESYLLFWFLITAPFSILLIFFRPITFFLKFCDHFHNQLINFLFPEKKKSLNTWKILSSIYIIMPHITIKIGNLLDRNLLKHNSLNRSRYDFGIYIKFKLLEENGPYHQIFWKYYLFEKSALNFSSSILRTFLADKLSRSAPFKMPEE